METEILIPPSTGAEGAGPTPGKSSIPPEGPIAVKGAEPDKGKKPEAAPKPEEGPKGWIPKYRLEETAKERDEARGKLQKLEEKGIYDEETAEQILSQVDEYRDLTRVMRDDPVAFVTKWSQESPEGYSHFATAMEQRGVQNYLQEAARSYRASGSTAEADFLDGLLKDHAGKRTQPATAQPRQAQQPQDGTTTQRYVDFHEDVVADVGAVLDRMVNELTAEAQLSEKAKATLRMMVGMNVKKAVDADERFMLGLNRYYDRTTGQTRQARTEAVKAYEKRLKVGGLVEREVKDALEMLATNAANGSQQHTKVPDAAGKNREAAAGGPPAAGVTSQEDRASMKSAIEKDYTEGKIDAVKRNQRMLSLPRAS